MILNYKKTKNKKEKVWGYIRRNPQFKYMDVLIICGVSKNYLNNMLWHLTRANYISKLDKKTSLDDRYYIHSKGVKFGVKSPVLRKI
jgi:hypothetical protein